MLLFLGFVPSMIFCAFFGFIQTSNIDEVFIHGFGQREREKKDQLLPQSQTDTFHSAFSPSLTHNSGLKASTFIYKTGDISTTTYFFFLTSKNKEKYKRQKESVELDHYLVELAR